MTTYTFKLVELEADSNLPKVRAFVDALTEGAEKAGRRFVQFTFSTQKRPVLKVVQIKTDRLVALIDEESGELLVCADSRWTIEDKFSERHFRRACHSAGNLFVEPLETILAKPEVQRVMTEGGSEDSDALLRREMGILVDSFGRSFEDTLYRGLWDGDSPEWGYDQTLIEELAEVAAKWQRRRDKTKRPECVTQETAV